MRYWLCWAGVIAVLLGAVLGRRLFLTPLAELLPGRVIEELLAAHLPRPSPASRAPRPGHRRRYAIDDSSSPPVPPSPTARPGRAEAEAEPQKGIVVSGIAGAPIITLAGGSLDRPLIDCPERFELVVFRPDQEPERVDLDAVGDASGLRRMGTEARARLTTKVGIVLSDPDTVTDTTMLRIRVPLERLAGGWLPKQTRLMAYFDRVLSDVAALRVRTALSRAHRRLRHEERRPRRRSPLVEAKLVVAGRAVDFVVTAVTTVNGERTRFDPPIRGTGVACTLG